MQTKRVIITYDISDLMEYINWIYFFHAWGFQPRFAAVAEMCACEACRRGWLSSFKGEDGLKASEALMLFSEAKRMLNVLDRRYKIRAVYRLMDANADGDNIVFAGNVRLPLLRQQTSNRADGAYLCLSDFIRPASSGVTDTVGLFAATAGDRIESNYEGDDYKLLLAKTLCERLAEAAAEKMHETVRKHVWGYAPDEQLSIQEMLREDWQGIRPAVGYPSLPDISVSYILDELLGMSEIGIRLTETGMMMPHASVCGLMLAHPAATYFSVGKIDEVQLADYAARRGFTVEKMRQFLSSNLQ